MPKDNVKNLLTNKNGNNDKRNKTINIALSVVLAVILWGYVIGLVDPETDRSLPAVNVSVAGRVDLRDRGLAVVETGPLTASVQITGKRSNIYSVKESQVRASIDVSKCELGENQVSVSIDTISGVSESEAKPESVTVVVNRIITETKPVEVIADGELPSGYELGAIDLEEKELDVTGGSSLVNKVVKLQARLAVSDGAENYAAKLEVIPVDENGDAVDGLTVEQEWVYVEAKLQKTKSVELVTTFTGTEPGDLVLSREVPKRIKIKGAKDVVASISAITADPVDLTGITENTKYKLSLNLPEGVELADGQRNPSATITVEKVTTKNIGFTSSDLVINGTSAGKKASITESNFTVTVKGSAAQLQRVTKENTTIYIDLTGFEGTKGTFPVFSNSTVDVKGITIAPNSVTVNMISEE